MEDKRVSSLCEIRQQFDATEADVRDLVEGLTDAQLAWQPSAEKWSIALCLEHLNKTGDFYLDALTSAIADAPSCSGPPIPSRPGWFERKFLNAVAPGSKFKAPAPKKVVPRLDRAPAAVVEHFFGLQERQRKALASAEGIDVNRTKFRSPLAKILKLRVGVGFQLNALHQQRHILQAERVRAEAAFPEVSGSV